MAVIADLPRLARAHGTWMAESLASANLAGVAFDAFADPLGDGM
jgi:hypothetical protein